MNKIQYVMSLVLMCVISMAAAAQNTVTLGYCNSEITDNDYRMTQKRNYAVMAAVRIPAARLGALAGKGAKITKIRIGAEAGMTSTYVWVRPSLNGAALAIQRLGTSKDGWNEVTLAQPYEITGEDIYVGYNCSLPAGTAIIFNGQSNPNGAHVSVGGTWQDLYGEAQGSLCIQAVVESDAKLPAYDLGIEALDMDDKYAKNGDTRSFSMSVANYGTSAVDMPRLHYQVADGAVGDIEVPDQSPLASGEVRSLSFDALVDGLPEGEASMRVWLDGSDEYAANDSYTKSIYVYSTSYPHKMLMEQFTTLACQYCPLGDKVLSALAANRSDVVWVAHHVGFGTDQFTVEPSEDIMDYGIRNAPRAMFDRSITGASENNQPSFGTGYDLKVGVAVLAPELDAVRKRPAFVSVGIESQYDSESRKLSLKVSGQRNRLFGQIYPNSNLTVYLVEDSLVSRIAQTGGTPADTIHNHVLRECLTESLGDPIEWSGDSYSQDFEYILPTEYNVDNLKVVAFVHRPLSDGLTNCEVLNTEALKVATQTTGIGGVEADVNEAGARQYYNMQGQRLTEAPAGGVYIERVRTAGGVRSVKRVARK